MPILLLDHDDWEPPDKLLDLINATNSRGRWRMRQIDRAELVIAFYSVAHGGNSPTYEVIGEIMGCGRSNAFRFVNSLILAGRAERKGGKLILKESKYSHPAIAGLSSEDIGLKISM